MNACEGTDESFNDEIYGLYNQLENRKNADFEKFLGEVINILKKKYEELKPECTLGMGQGTAKTLGRFFRITRNTTKNARDKKNCVDSELYSTLKKIIKSIGNNSYLLIDEISGVNNFVYNCLYDKSSKGTLHKRSLCEEIRRLEEDYEVYKYYFVKRFTSSTIKFNPELNDAFNKNLRKTLTKLERCDNPIIQTKTKIIIQLMESFNKTAYSASYKIYKDYTNKLIDYLKSISNELGENGFIIKGEAKEEELKKQKAIESSSAKVAANKAAAEEAARKNQTTAGITSQSSNLPQIINRLRNSSIRSNTNMLDENTKLQIKTLLQNMGKPINDEQLNRLTKKTASELLSQLNVPSSSSSSISITETPVPSTLTPPLTATNQETLEKISSLERNVELLINMVKAQAQTTSQPEQSIDFNKSGTKKWYEIILAELKIIKKKFDENKAQFEGIAKYFNEGDDNIIKIIESIISIYDDSLYSNQIDVAIERPVTDDKLGQAKTSFGAITTGLTKINELKMNLTFLKTKFIFNLEKIMEYLSTVTKKNSIHAFLEFKIKYIESLTNFVNDPNNMAMRGGYKRNRNKRNKSKVLKRVKLNKGLKLSRRRR